MMGRIRTTMNHKWYYNINYYNFAYLSTLLYRYQGQSRRAGMAFYYGVYRTEEKRAQSNTRWEDFTDRISVVKITAKLSKS
jgi:hypothetical protein